MKILHCADVHLGRRPVGGRGEFSNIRFEDYFNSFEFVVNYAVEKKIDVLIISGDFFDRKEIIPDVLDRTEIFLEKLRNNNIEIILIEGNHDNISKGNENDSWLIFLEKKGYIKRPYYEFKDNKYIFHPVKINGCIFYGIGYPGSFVNEILRSLAEFIEDKNNNNIILVHTSIFYDDFLPGSVEKDTIDLFNGKTIYMAAGHAHSFFTYPKKDPYFFVPGSLDYWDLGEKKDKKGFIIYDTDTKKYDFIKSNLRNKIEVIINIKSSNFENFKKEFISEIDKIELGKEDIIYIVLKQDKNFYINLNWCEEILEQRGVLKSIVKLKGTIDSEINNENERNIAADEVEKDIIKKWDYFSKNYENVFNSLKKMKIHQQEKNEKLFIDEFDNMLEMIINSGNEK